MKKNIMLLFLCTVMVSCTLTIENSLEIERQSPILTFTNVTTTESVVVKEFATVPNIAVNAEDKIRVDFTLEGYEFLENKPAVEMELMYLDKKISISKLPFSHEFTFPDMDYGVYPLRVTGSWTFAKNDSGLFVDDSSSVAFSLPSEGLIVKMVVE